MTRSRNLVPKYELHKRSGIARVRWCGNEVWLGKYGTPESLKEYARVCAEIRASQVPKAPSARSRVTVDEVIEAFSLHASTHYRAKDGSHTSEFREYGRSLVHLAPLYGQTSAADFGPLAIQTVRQKMIEAGWCRTLINKRIVRIRSMFRWAVSQQLVPVDVVNALKCVQGLQKGRSAAPEAEPVEPAPLEHVNLALPFLDRYQRTMAQLQLNTGMRPGEVCVLRLCELERTGPIWIWRPEAHKTEWREKDRTILFNPFTQELIATFLNECPDPLRPKDTDWLFSPRAARVEHLAARKAARKTPVRPWEARRARAANPKRQPAERFNVGGYGHALVAACEKAGVPKFLPNQLRHTFATLVRKEYGLEAAQVLLGHARADVTQIYAERDLALALRVIGSVKVG